MNYSSRYGLNSEQMKEFERRYQGAVSYMLACQVINEYRYLNDNEYILNDWQKNRLAELRRMEAEFGRNILEETP